MQHDSRVPVTQGYAEALGRAAYIFSYLEWGIVWLAETMSPGFLERVSGMTAGTIAREFDTLVQSCAANDADALRRLSSTFAHLVKDRNALLHGVPYTAQGGEQRLLHLGPNGRRDWTEKLVREAGRRFELAALEASQLLHAGRYEAYTALTGKSLSV